MTGPKNDIPLFGFALLSILIIPCNIKYFIRRIYYYSFFFSAYRSLYLESNHLYSDVPWLILLY